MADTQETIADIIAEMCDWLGDANGYDLRYLADRLEAAWKREKATAEKSLVVGDAAKLREALLRCDAIAQLPEVRNEQSIKDMRNIIRQALSEPPRNCDRFATLEDAYKAHREICEEYGACNKACVYKSGHSGTYQCFEAWLFAPATEQKGENDANK